MSAAFVSSTARVVSAAMSQMGQPAAWPDPASGFAYRLLTSTSTPLPAVFSGPLRPTSSHLLRRAPELAAFGYVIPLASRNTLAEWVQAFERLMGRKVFPPDRNSFVYNPLELIGIAFGVAECPAATDRQRAWLAKTIERGFAERQFAGPIGEVAAACAEHIVAVGASGPSARAKHPAMSLQTNELTFLAALALLFPDRAFIDVAEAEMELISRVLTAEISTNDVADAAALYVLMKRSIDQITAGCRDEADVVERVVGLCRRFQLFVDRLQARQRNRKPYSVDDEYDVQDLLHAILKLHFDDVRPEEWIPSYAGTSSRTDFLLPQQRTIIEAKMTRSGLGPKEVVNQLIIDVARYSKAAHVDNLVCLIYDPTRRCANPTAIERDVRQTQSRLRVEVVVCPRGV